VPIEKGPFEDRALHFEVRHQCVSPSRARDDALKTEDIDSNSGQHRGVNGRVVRLAGAGIAAGLKATPRCGRIGDADRRLLEWRRCDRLTAV